MFTVPASIADVEFFMALMPPDPEVEKRHPRRGVAYENDMLVFNPDGTHAALEAAARTAFGDGEWRRRGQKAALVNFADIVRQRIYRDPIEVNFHGDRVKLDRETVQQIVMAHALAQVEPDRKFHWKLADGRIITLSAEEMIELTKAAAARLQKDFAIEAELRQGIDAGHITKKQQIEEAFAAA